MFFVFASLLKVARVVICNSEFKSHLGSGVQHLAMGGSRLLLAKRALVAVIRAVAIA